MRWRVLLTGIGYAVGAILLALLVTIPIFLIVNWIYRDGDGIIALVVVVVLAWFLLARQLLNRRIHL